jgi:hypothetical protein
MSTIDILNAAVEKDPSAFASAVELELNTRIADAIEDRRKEVASTMFDLDDDDNDDGDDDQEEDE